MGVDASRVWATRRARARREAEGCRERARAARARLPELVALCREAGAREVLLFGSLTTGDLGRVDVDLAVRGVTAGDYDELLGRLLQAVAPEYTVDLVRLEEAPQTLVARIAEEGERLG